MTREEMAARLLALRETIKAYTAKDLADHTPTDEDEGIAPPPLVKARKALAKIDLPRDHDAVLRHRDVLELFKKRCSVRAYAQEPLSLAELSFLLWATQGAHKVVGTRRQVMLRTVPSAGARHPLETHVIVRDVTGLARGVYAYDAFAHRLLFQGAVADQEQAVADACCGQTFVGNAPVCFFWTAVPYRTEWRYQAKAARYILLDAGHVCENLYLACGAIGCGTCAIGAMNQAKADALVQHGGAYAEDHMCEFVIYAAPVGRLETPSRGV